MPGLSRSRTSLRDLLPASGRGEDALRFNATVPASEPGCCPWSLCCLPCWFHHLLLVTTDHLMAAGFLQTVRRAVVAFLAMVFGVGLLAGGLLGFFLGRAVGRRG
jgi:hypothetical protein